MVAAFLAALLWNDLHDREADRINEPGRRRALGVLSDPEARSLAFVAASLALFLALAVGYAPFLLMTAVLLLAWLYSAPPVRTKRWPGAATLTLGLLSLLSLACGYSLYAQEMTLSVLPWRLGGYLLIGVTLGFTAKDLKDAAGDRATGVRTLATLLPERTARGVTAALVAIGYLLGPIFLPLGAAFTILSILFAAASVGVTLRRRRPDRVLLAGFLIFAVLCLGFLTQRPAILRERAPAPLREWQAQLRAAEEDVRLVRVCEEDAVAARAMGDPPPRASIATVLDRLLALVPAVGAAAPMEERARWAHAQVAAWPAAIEDFGALIRLRPSLAEYWDGVLAAASREGNPVAALGICLTAIDNRVRPGDFFRNRAAAAIAAGSAGPPAARDLAAAFSFGQREPLCWVLFGDLALRRGDPATAADAYAHAAEREPRLAEAWAGMGAARHARGDLAGALDAFARARALAPRDPWIISNEGVVLRDANRIEEARERFAQAHAIAPDLFEPLFNLGLTCERLGRREDARRWYDMARRVRPDFAPLEEALHRLGAGTPSAGGGKDR
jgi:4-hydroxybenzoate polyprenyltransferase